jgi:hypothetical protein
MISGLPMAKDKSPSRADGTASQFDKLDLLVGAEAIAMFMFGDPDATRRIYHAWDAHGLPAFKVGQTLWARKGALVAWVAAKELETAPPSHPHAM